MLERYQGETESLADRRHSLRRGEEGDDARRAVEDGAYPASGPRACRDYDAARRLVLGAPPVREVVAGRDVGLPPDEEIVEGEQALAVA